jgi:hypothetical protein
MITYTVDICGRDDVIQVPTLTPGMRYFCFSDRKDVPFPYEHRELTVRLPCPRATSLWYKTHPHLCLPAHNISVFVNASVWNRQSIAPLLGAEFGVHRHRTRIDLFTEGQVCATSGLVDPAQMHQQLAYYRDTLPANHTTGLWESGVLVRANTERVIQINTLWWDHLQRFTMRDQVSLAYLQYQKPFITDLPGTLADSAYFAFVPHGGPLPETEQARIAQFPQYSLRRAEWAANVRRLSPEQGGAVPLA